MILGELVRDLDRFADRVAIVADGRTVTYSQLIRDSNRLANGLAGLGLQQGDRFAFLLPNGYRILCCYAACAISGLVGVPLATRITAADLVHQLRDSGAVALLYASESKEILEQSRDQLPGVRHFICDGQDDDLTYAGLLGCAAEHPPPTDIGADDAFCVMYTGVTTGPSKAAVQTQRAWAACLLDAVAQLHYRADDRHVVVLPMTHAAWFTLGAHLLVGARTHIMSRWDPFVLLSLVEREQLTTLHMIPTLLTDLLANPNLAACDLSSVRLLTLAGSPIPLELYERARSVFGDIIGNIYGLTEAAGPVTFLLPADMNPTRIRSGGRAGRYVEISILDETDEAREGVKLGEIALRGPQITSGYLNRPDETAEAFHGEWFRTGDVGYVGPDGFLYIVDRKKDMIKSGGFNVYPKEVEEVLYQHPSVREAAVVGVPDPKWMEAVVAAVVLEIGAPVTSADLVAYCRERLANYKVPKAIHLETALPRTAFGKFDKKALQRRFGSALEAADSPSY
jgi:acyl-CoA synthetase (AMP-forming)/AMP-acid ligase II